MNAIGYIRVSTDMQADKGTSLDNQVEKIIDFCQKKGLFLENIYEDAGFSGKNTKRPGFQDMMKRINKGGVSSLIVWHSTRFARNLRDFINHMDLLEKKKIKFYSIEEPEMSGSSGKAMRNLMAVFAEYQSDVTGEYTRSVKNNLKKNKKVYCAYPPLGYKNDNGILVEDPKQLELVQTVTTLKAEGYSLRQIAQHFNSQGITGAKNGKFHASTIQKILSNNIYELQTK
jgi:DNA invertase Pin-like site-specific DNA recombinase